MRNVVQLYAHFVVVATVSKCDVCATKDSAKELLFCGADGTILVDNWFECVADVCHFVSFPVQPLIGYIDIIRTISTNSHNNFHKMWKTFENFCH